MLHGRLIAEQAAILHSKESRMSSQAVLAHIQQYERDRLTKLERLRKQENDERDRKYLAILEWFSAAQTTISDHESFCRTRVPYKGTGEWILEHEKIQNWMGQDTPVSSTMWMNGIPGAGRLLHILSFETPCLYSLLIYA